MKAIKWLLILLALPCVAMLINFAVWLLNQRDDLMALAGYGIFIILAVTACWFVHRRWERLKNFWTPPALALVILSLGSMGCYTVVEPGRVGIKVKQVGADRGVQEIPTESGRVFYNPINEYVLEYPTSIQRAIWAGTAKEGSQENQEIEFQSLDSLHFTGDVAVAYHLPAATIPKFYVEFRHDDLRKFTQGFFRDAVRKAVGRAANKFTAEEINGSKQAELEAAAQEALIAGMKPYGVIVDQLVFTSPPRPPAQVKTAIEAKIAAIQSAERVENQKREAIAEGEKVKTMAKATAEANHLINASISAQLVEWKKLDVMGARWNGQGPTVVSSQGQGMIIDLRNLGAK